MGNKKGNKDNEEYKKPEEIYNELIQIVGNKARDIDKLKDIKAACVFFDEKYPGKEDYDEFVDELLKFAIEILEFSRSPRLSAKPDKSYHVLYKYLKLLTLQRNAYHPCWVVGTFGSFQ
jgi:hypothetical protein